MLRFREKGLIFGVSVTLTTENLREVTSEAFLGALTEKGCKLVIFVEYVPVTEDSRHLAPGDAERAYLAEAMERLRGTCDEAVLLSFPGDELAMGGCMAAGREFFHINSHGGAEPCPFSPYSDVNIRDTSLREAIASPLFRALQEQGVLRGEHVGGCVLYEKRDQVEALWNGNGVIEPQEIAVSRAVAEIESRQPEADEDGTISVRAENRFMRSAINEALDGISHGHGGPFGAVIVRDGRIVGRGHNRVLADNDPTCHGEIAAIRDACAKQKSHDLKGCELYTTGEPCPMCLFACRWANIDRVYYGCTIADNALIGFRDEAFDDLMGGRERFAAYLRCVDREACLMLFRRYAEMQREAY
jgi:tRNA(Arg) A34 adenosine deaminase TadA